MTPTDGSGRADAPAAATSATGTRASKTTKCRKRSATLLSPFSRRNGRSGLLRGSSCKSRPTTPRLGVTTLPSFVRLGHRAIVQRLVEHRFLDSLLTRNLTQRATASRGLLHDLRRTVISDVRVERRRGRQRQLGVALRVLAVGLDPVDALLGEETRRAREQLHGV